MVKQMKCIKNINDGKCIIVSVTPGELEVFVLGRELEPLAQTRVRQPRIEPLLCRLSIELGLGLIGGDKRRGGDLIGL